MSDDLILDFPVLSQGSGDFLEEISYEIDATRISGEIKVTYAQKGQSFIRELLKNKIAVFSVSLRYKDSSERQNHSCDILNINDNEITAEQVIPLSFSYAPEIVPSIVVLKDKKITVDDSSGLTDFWKNGEHFDIPKYSRIALGTKIKFTSGGLESLMKVKCAKEYKPGVMKVIVIKNAGEGEIPVTLLCATDVYDQLQRIRKDQSEPRNLIDSVRRAIVTQALCAIYAYMQNHSNSQDYEVGGVLQAHLDELVEKTGESWENEGFNPSLAATKMQPYFLEALANGEYND